MENKKTNAGLILENESGEILVLRRKSVFPEGRKWGLVGGGVKNKQVHESLIEKIRQEIGLDVTPTSLEKLYKFNWTDPNIYFHLFRIKVKNDLKVKLNKAGHSKYLWLNPKILYKDYPLMRGLYKIIEKYYLQ